MKRRDIKSLIIIILLGINCIFSWIFFLKHYHQKDTVDINVFPKNIDGWSSKKLLITEEEYEILETRNAFARNYSSDSGQNVQLFIVYSQNNRKISHPPELCYLGSGFSVIDKKKDFIKDVSEKFKFKINKLKLEYGNTEQISCYWFKVGDSFTSSYWKQQLLIAYKTILGKPASSALIRVSASVEDDDKKAEEDIKEFSRLIIPLLYYYLP